VQPSFWILPVTGQCLHVYYLNRLIDTDTKFYKTAVSVQGSTLTANPNAQSLAAIDTGTTLIGGPTAVVTEIYSKIPDSQPLSGQMQGYFSIRKTSLVILQYMLMENLIQLVR
jgi:hypothetical protein